MPSRSTKQFKASSPASATFPAGSQRVSPANDLRTLLVIENTGANPGLVHFKEQVQGDGSDFLVAAGGFLNYQQSDTCPTEAVNIGSTLGTTWAILEQVTRS